MEPGTFLKIRNGKRPINSAILLHENYLHPVSQSNTGQDSAA